MTHSLPKRISLVVALLICGLSLQMTATETKAGVIPRVDTAAAQATSGIPTVAREVLSILNDPDIPVCC